jgi:phage internal scaffolding protein
MSKEFRDLTGDVGVSKTSPEMRLHVQRPGRKRSDGSPLYFTEQSHKKECDVNHILKKYDKTGVITHVSKFEARFGNLSGIDFKQMKDAVAAAETSFHSLPSEIRNEFQNDPAELLKFMEDPNNRKKAEALGIIDPAWTEDTDGLGEHVELGENKKKTPPEDITPSDV